MRLKTNTTHSEKDVTRSGTSTSHFIGSEKKHRTHRAGVYGRRPYTQKGGSLNGYNKEGFTTHTHPIPVALAVGFVPTHFVPSNTADRICEGRSTIVLYPNICPMANTPLIGDRPFSTMPLASTRLA